MAKPARLSDLTPEEKAKLLRKVLTRRTSRQADKNSDEAIAALRPLQNEADSQLDIPQSFYKFDQFPAYQQLQTYGTVADHADVTNPYFRSFDGLASNVIEAEGRRLLNFSSYNYLGLNGHPRVAAAVHEAVQHYGMSASASRIVSGERPIHRQLEEALADLHGAEDAVAFVSGHATNMAAISTLMGPRDLVLHDSLAHNSAIQGIQLSGAARQVFPHNDWQALERFLAENRNRFEKTLIFVEGLYSMDGDICPIDKLVEIKRRYKALLMVDEAHSVGVLGKKGFGVGEHFGLSGDDVDIWMGTLSKTFSACGGYIAGSSALIEMLKFLSGGFVYSVGMPPPVAAAALESLKLMQAEPERVERLQSNGRYFLEAVRSKGLDTGRSEGYGVTCVVTGRSLYAAQLSNGLYARGVNVAPIIYPAVEERAARLRFFLSSLHTKDDMDEAVELLAEEYAALESEV